MLYVQLLRSLAILYFLSYYEPRSQGFNLDLRVQNCQNSKEHAKACFDKLRNHPLSFDFM